MFARLSEPQLLGSSCVAVISVMDDVQLQRKQYWGLRPGARSRASSVHAPGAQYARSCVLASRALEPLLKGNHAGEPARGLVATAVASVTSPGLSRPAGGVRLAQDEPLLSPAGCPALPGPCIPRRDASLAARSACGQSRIDTPVRSAVASPTSLAARIIVEALLESVAMAGTSSRQRLSCSMLSRSVGAAGRRPWLIISRPGGPSSRWASGPRFGGVRARRVQDVPRCRDGGRTIGEKVVPHLPPENP